MKNLILIAAMFVSFSNQAMAHLSVDESPVVMSAELETIEINHEWLNDVESGSITVDVTKQEITLSLVTGWTCPPNMACIAVMPEPVVIKLPIVNTYSDWCGSTTYEAEIDATPADGLYETLVVTDYSNLNCRIAMPYMTKIEYRTFNPWVQDWTSSHFTAGLLTLHPVFMN